MKISLIGGDLKKGVGNMGYGNLKFFHEGKIKNGVVTAISDFDERKRTAAKNICTETCAWMR